MENAYGIVPASCKAFQLLQVKQLTRIGYLVVGSVGVICANHILVKYSAYLQIIVPLDKLRWNFRCRF